MLKPILFLSLVLLLLLDIPHSYRKQNAKAPMDCEEKFYVLCGDTESMDPLPADHPSGLYYRYELTLFRLAGADWKETDEVVNKKIGAFFKANAKCLTCASITLKKEKIGYLQMVIALGQIYAFERIVDVYGFPLNVTVGDDGSILDYIYKDYVYYKRSDVRSARARDLKRLYQLCKEKGAKHVLVTPSDRSIEGD